eukprot:CFRG6990T1
MAFVKQNGYPDWDLWTNDERKKKAAVSVQSWLLERKFEVTRSEVCEAAASLVKLQESLYGRDVMNPRRVKLPQYLFTDMDSNGSLCHILHAACSYMKQKGIDSWKDIADGKPGTEDIIDAIETELLQKTPFEWPRVYFDPVDIAKEKAQQLGAIVEKWNGVVVDSVLDATRIVKGFGEEPEEDAGPEDDWMRPVERKGAQVLVHWWYRPDSYDNLVPISEVTEEPQKTETAMVYTVSTRYILDTNKYHEWVNPEDYQDEEVVAVDVAASTLTTTASGSTSKPRKRKGKGRLTSSRSKRSRRSSTATNSVTMETSSTVTMETDTVVPKSSDPFDSMEAPASPAVEVVDVKKKEEMAGTKKDPDMQRVRGGQVVNASHTDGSGKDPHFADAVTAEEKPGTTGDDNVEPQATDIPLQKADNTTEEDRETTGKPSVATIQAKDDTPKEKVNGDTMEVVTTSLQNGEITAEVPDVENDGPDRYYAEQTDLVVVPSHSAWFDYNAIHSIEKRALPEFFSGTARSKTPEIYMGYRNFMVDTYRLRPKEYLTATACRRNMTGDVCAIIRVHAFLEQWGLINYQADFDLRSGPLGPPSTSHFRVAAETPDGVHHIRTTTVDAAKTVDELIKLDDTDAMRKKLQVRRDQYMDNGRVLCGTCGAQCEGVLYKSSKTTPEVVLCADCLAEGKFPEEYNSNDFVRQVLKDDSVKLWDDQETLRLLEGIEMYKDDWSQISEHVGTHDPAECVLHFLRLPIQDPYLEPDTTNIGPLAYNPVPFSQTGNPIMNTVAFLASVVDPSVAAAAAEAALVEYKTMDADGWESDNNERKPTDLASKDEPKPVNEKAQKKIQQAAATCMSMAAVKAHALAEKEETEIRGLMAEIVELQLKKLEIKMSHFESLESLMESEYHKLEVQRKELLRDKIKFQELKLERENLQNECDSLRAAVAEKQERLTKQPSLSPSPALTSTISGAGSISPAPTPIPTPTPTPTPIPIPALTVDGQSTVFSSIAEKVSPISSHSPTSTPTPMPTPTPSSSNALP